MLETRDKLGLGQLQDTDLIPMINYAWKHSFARIDKNKNAISDRGWNPLNRNILTDRDLRATMTHREKCREHEMRDDIILPKKYLSKNILQPSTDCDTTATKSSCSDFSINSQSLTTINNNVHLPALNFSSGTSQACLDAIVKDSDLQKARERIKENLNKGNSIKEQLREAKRITSGTQQKNNHDYIM